MARRVAILGIGAVPARAATPEVSYRELTFQAAQAAYADAGIRHTDVESVVCCEEDFHEGVSISDEYTPDQLGAVLRSVETTTGDGLHGIAMAALQVASGLFDVVVVESHSKASNIRTFDHVTAFALDPLWTRPLGLHPDFIAGLEMARFLHEARATEEICARVVAKNRANALRNPRAAYGASISAEDVLHSPVTFSPLRELHSARRADGGAVVVVGSEERARKSPHPVWILGTGWCNDTSSLASRPWGGDGAIEKAAKLAYGEAGIRNPKKEIDYVEVDDLYAHRELLSLRALGLQGTRAPVNDSGGSLGVGHLLDCTGLYRLAACVDAVRSGRAKKALAQSWRGVPTTSVAVTLLGGERG